METTDNRQPTLKEVLQADDNIRKGLYRDRSFYVPGLLILFYFVESKYSDRLRRDIDDPIFRNPGVLIREELFSRIVLDCGV